MVSDERKWKGKRPSQSSPEYFRRDTKKEREKKAAKKEAKESLQKLERKNLQEEIARDQEKSRPERERKKEISEAQEHHGSAKDFSEKMLRREEVRQAAIEQSEPETKDEKKG